MMRKNPSAPSVLCAIVLAVALLATLATTLSPAQAQTATASASSHTVLRIDGMSTPACPALVKSALRRLPGVRSVEASLAQRSATVEFDAAKTSVEEMRRAIKRDVGFDAEVWPASAAP
jgi:periplasmic mercuric ion binding protein